MAGVRVVFIRHGQAEHNVAHEYDIKDPLLTGLGREQAQALGGQEHLESALKQEGSIVVVSPLRRTLQTALLGFGQRTPPARFVLKAEVQETGFPPCDTADAALGCALLEEEGRPDLVQQYTALGEEWLSKTGDYADEDGAIMGRFMRFTRWLLQEKPPAALVVAHYGLISRTLGPELKNGESVAYTLTPEGEWKRAD
eukprot:Hpha_TRINITY_DN19647_c0_g1::TRINITY_DN19647_c0_g1_i1::g.186159::m.186159